MFKKEKGITLVALVVTIVVLLILAGVSLSLVIGQQGLVGRAQNAQNTYNQGKTNDQKDLNSAEEWIENTIK